jgi:hypothetical protein
VPSKSGANHRLRRFNSDTRTGADGPIIIRSRVAEKYVKSATQSRYWKASARSGKRAENGALPGMNEEMDTFEKGKRRNYLMNVVEGKSSECESTAKKEK